MDPGVGLVVLVVAVLACGAAGLWLGRRSSPIDLRDPTTGQELDPDALERDEPRGLPASAYPGERVYMRVSGRAFGPPAQHDYIGSIANVDDDDSAGDDRSK